MKKQNPIKKLASQIKSDAKKGDHKQQKSVKKILAKPEPYRLNAKPTEFRTMYAFVSNDNKNPFVLRLSNTRKEAIQLWLGWHPLSEFKKAQQEGWSVKAFKVEILK